MVDLSLYETDKHYKGDFEDSENSKDVDDG